VNWAAQAAFGTDFYDRSTRTIVGTMLWTEYRPVIKIGLKGAGALGSHEIRPIHSAPSLGQSIVFPYSSLFNNLQVYWKIRMNAQVAHHGMTCLVQLASLNGIFTSKNDRLDYISNFVRNFNSLVHRYVFCIGQ